MEYLLQITSGRGPAECCWVVAQVLKQMNHEAKSNSIEFNTICKNLAIEKGTLFSATVEIKGNGAAKFVKNWKGTIQWIGQSPFRKFHKRKNWFIGVDLMEERNDREIHPSEIKYETFRSSGPGGQHANKVSTAVRAIHISTGVTATASNTRSQLQNKKLVKKRLLEEVRKFELRQKSDADLNNWMQHNLLKRGNPTRVFTGANFIEK